MKNRRRVKQANRRPKQDPEKQQGFTQQLHAQVNRVQRWLTRMPIMAQVLMLFLVTLFTLPFSLKPAAQSSVSTPASDDMVGRAVLQ